jgi:hypothetical protein
MTTPKNSADGSNASVCSSATVLFVYDDAKNVIRLGDGGEIHCCIIERIDYEYDDGCEPGTGYKVFRPCPLDAIIHIKDGWLWRNLKAVRALDYVR